MIHFTKTHPAFALPTILIASVVMIIVMLAAIQSVVSIRIGLDNQYYDKLGQEAAESGAVKAKACIQQSGFVTWSNTNPLRPNTDCTGGSACTNAPSCYVLSSSNISTTFRVSAPDTTTPDGYVFKTDSQVDLLRTSNSLPWKTYTRTQNIKINTPQQNNGGIATGTYVTCAIASNNNPYCWGSNANGQLGNNSTTDSLVPVAVNTAGVLAGKTIRSMDSGDSHTCVIASDDKVYCWGYNGLGQLGNNSTTTSLVPVAVNTAGVLAGKTIRSVSAGGGHTCVIASDDKVYCWGYNFAGQLGNNSTTNSLVPIAVDTTGVLAGKTIRSVSVGYQHSCVIASDNNAYCWGYNPNGQLGNNSTANSLVPVAVNTAGALAGKTIRSVSSGLFNTCAIASDSKVYCWGGNSTGALGNNSTTTSLVPAAVDTTGVLAGKTISTVSAGGNYACVIASDGKAYCWGTNTSGQLGDNSVTNRLVPVAVDTSGLLAGKTVLSISSGALVLHTCAFASDNKAYCWGHGGLGNLGNNSTTTSPVPVLVDSFVSRLPAAISVFYY